MTTLHVEDIRADLQRSDRSGMEDAFRALVNWPDETAIAGSTEPVRRDLLRRVCAGLVDGENGRQMPGDIRGIILDEADDLTGGTYADGARAVLATSAFFDRLGAAG